MSEFVDGVDVVDIIEMGDWLVARDERGDSERGVDNGVSEDSFI